VYVEDGDSQDNKHAEMAAKVEAMKKAGAGGCSIAHTKLMCYEIYMPCEEIKLGGELVAIPQLPCKDLCLEAEKVCDSTWDLARQ
jgi:hypothetical protein